MTLSVKDQEKRLKALDPSQSFIVQAPAGSGKTELLTQRFLVLLASVRYAPEEVVAITFTRKAASEMRSRILESLHFAATQPPPEKSHALQTWELAKKVLIRDVAAKWNILDNPNRLRVTTIDSLCARIAKSAPLVSRFGALPQVVEDAQMIYREATHRLLASLDENAFWHDSLEKILLHLDNNYSLLENLLVGMLNRRDQWLSCIVDQRHAVNPRELLERGLQNIILDTLKRAQTLFPREDQVEFLSLINFASYMLMKNDKESNIRVCENLLDFPSAELSSLNKWQGLAELLLTKTFDWRRAVNKTSGFPAVSDAINQEEKVLFKSMKERMTKLLGKFAENEPLRIILKDILLLPVPYYSEQQWEIVNALIQLLPILVAHLTVIFRERNVTDFIAITEGAIHALGDSDEPSDIALNLDFKIQHLLVDEFQDTSITQYRLLQLLVSGWEINDGRTLFLVGDPMQSIYRFREANVGIFLKVKDFGLGNIKLHPLKLEVNFRSQPEIVNWFNATFKNIFPKYESHELGAITFSPSTAFTNESKVQAGVSVHSFIHPEENEEASYIAELIQRELNENNEKSIAILVRSRNHLQQIIPTLKSAKIKFQAIEIEKLLYSPAVQDLLALTKALSHTADRISWLAILRAPWCGLSLADLFLIANYNSSETIFETLINYKKITALSEEAVIRLQRIVPVFVNAIKERSRESVRSWVAGTWYALGGPACIDEEHELLDADFYLKLLDEFCGYSISDLTAFENTLSHSYCHVDAHEARVHIMTIHKSKGLEFDIVIIPSLEKKPAIDENRLLLWLERQTDQGEANLILAPMRSSEEDFDPIYRYIRTQDAIKSQFEITRLLYVAVTRAKYKLHLLGSIFNADTKNDKEPKSPGVGSLLYLLWNSVKEKFNNDKIGTSQDNINIDEPQSLTRLSLDWEINNIIQPVCNTTQTISEKTTSWSYHYLPQVGTLIHELLQKISNNHVEIANTLIMDRMHLQKKLLKYGVLKKDLTICLQLVEKAINQTLADERGRWILSNEHKDAYSEFPITIYSEKKLTHYIIDRTFVDKNNIRWIIDYKTSELTDENKISFLTNAKQRYQKQLENYAHAMELVDQRPIKLALYFPLFSGWCEWSYHVST